jgi:uncharacterized protein (DUF1800 family)
MNLVNSARIAAIVAVVSGLLPVLSWAQQSGRSGLSPREQAGYVLDRLAYGPRPGDVTRVVTMGTDAYIDRQLAPEVVPENPRLVQELASLSTLRMSPVELFAAFGPPRPAPGMKRDPGLVKAARQRGRIVLQQLIAARLARAINSNHQLEEVMTEFWFSHFNIFAGKGLDYLWIGSFEEQAIRPYVLGRFRDLLEATAKHPAMLFYLDNWLNQVPGGKKGINENYAREVMELHTLGSDGGYTQADVIALAHILTGWGFPRPALVRRMPVPPTAFYFDPDKHDFSAQTFLGSVIPAGGIEQGERALDMLARSPATAHHIAFELVQFFVADKPDPAYVNAVARRFEATDGDVRATLRALFHDRRFWAGAAPGARKFKTPYEYVLSAVRIAGVTLDDPRVLQGLLFQMGMPLYRYQTPEGYKNTQDVSLNSDAMAKRIDFAVALARGKFPGEHDAGRTVVPLLVSAEPPRRNLLLGDAATLDVVALERAYGRRLSAKTQAAIDSAAPGMKAALLLAGPEFMQR